MDTQDDKTSSPAPTRSLKDAVRKARVAQAERTDVVVELRAAEIARLEMLQEELAAIFKQMDGDNTQFELALSQGQVPRLWIDMLSFVAMARDRKTYRFLRDTRAGRQVLAESEDSHVISDAVLDYVAHQIIEREKALADSLPLASAAAEKAQRPEQPAPAPRRRGFGVFSIFFAFLLGAAAAAVALLGYAYINVP